MKYNPEIHHRRSIRLQGYDYYQEGAYFVTVCTQNRACLFGNIVAGEMQLNDAGLAILRWYAELPNKFPAIEGDEFICMPNHVHFIVVNAVGANLRVRPDSIRNETDESDKGQTHRSAPTGIREPSAMYGHGVSCPGNEAWMI